MMMMAFSFRTKFGDCYSFDLSFSNHVRHKQVMDVGSSYYSLVLLYGCG